METAGRRRRTPGRSPFPLRFDGRNGWRSDPRPFALIRARYSIPSSGWPPPVEEWKAMLRCAFPRSPEPPPRSDHDPAAVTARRGHRDRQVGRDPSMLQSGSGSRHPAARESTPQCAARRTARRAPRRRTGRPPERRATAGRRPTGPRRRRPRQRTEGVIETAPPCDSCAEHRPTRHLRATDRSPTARDSADSAAPERRAASRVGSRFSR